MSAPRRIDVMATWPPVTARVTLPHTSVEATTVAALRVRCTGAVGEHARQEREGRGQNRQCRPRLPRPDQRHAHVRFLSPALQPAFHTNENRFH